VGRFTECDFWGVEGVQERFFGVGWYGLSFLMLRGLVGGFSLVWWCWVFCKESPLIRERGAERGRKTPICLAVLGETSKTQRRHVWIIVRYRVAIGVLSSASFIFEQPCALSPLSSGVAGGSWVFCGVSIVGLRSISMDFFVEEE